ncbi:MAG TPA: CsgE family curli-type amyloid fiber assembly protein [Sphingomicrobium sp.]|nr:CsgE family curli-type amyloid fiber assembly protein [Sphingomicrobium sp.]
MFTREQVLRGITSRRILPTAVLLCAAGSSIMAATAAEIIGQKDLFDTGQIESNEALVEKPLDENRVSGDVADQTMTQVGRGFMQGFQRAWRDYEGNGEMTIAVYERPSARWGSLIWVEQNFIRVYQGFLYPGRGDPTQIGETAAHWVHQRVAEIQAEKLLFKDPDIDKEEF